MTTASERTKAWKLAHPERTRELAREGMARWRAKNPAASSTSYGITTEEFHTLQHAQDFRCAICGREPSAQRRLAIDHDHDSGRVRGLLCNRCNTALGLLGDDADQVRRAADYLERH